MNEKLEQSKNEIVKEYGYESFESFDDNSTFGYDHRTPQIMDKVAIRYHELMDEWIYLNRNTNTFSDNYDMIVICWVNLQHGKPFFGTDIVTNVFDFDEYYNDYGRIVFKWKPLIDEIILLPEEVTDKQTLIEYMNILGF
jgi:hypothetical protein